MTDTRPSPAMETRREKLSNGQLISVPHKDTIRLLEVYVKRSLSVNDGTLSDRDDRRKEKWVTKRNRRHSSDPSIYKEDGKEDGGEDGSDDSEPEAFLPTVEPLPEEPVRTREKEKKKKKRSKKGKKSSFWKSFVGFLSRKSSKDKDEGQDSGTETSSEEERPKTPVTCLPIAQLPTQRRKKSMRRKTVKRRFSTKRLSLMRSFRHSKELSPADISDFEAVVSVEPTLSYYEKVSEELEKIVHEVKDKEEVKPMTDEEVINRIIELTKEQGDAIEDKLKDNPTLNNFFQGLPYASFKGLADVYLGKEVSPAAPPPTTPPTAPELVQLAFALDFTARVAGLSRQNAGHITGLGFRYLQETFKYNQACTDHPWSDTDD